MRHLRLAETGDQSHKSRVIRKIWSAGGAVVFRVYDGFPTRESALAEEVRLIALYGRDTLTNRTDGGEGAPGASNNSAGRPAGFRHSEETRRRIREAHRRLWDGDTRVREVPQPVEMARPPIIVVSRRTNQKPRLSPREKWVQLRLPHMRVFTARQMQAIRAWSTGRVKSPEERQKLSDSLKGRSFPRSKPMSEKGRKNIGDSRRGVPNPKVAEALRAYWRQRNENRSDENERLRKPMSEEHRARIAENMHRIWAERRATGVVVPTERRKTRAT
jgi:hypothetical protein